MPSCSQPHIRQLLLKSTILLVSLFISASLLSQKKSAVLSGKVVDEDDKPLSKVSVVILGRQNGAITTDSGTFTLRTPADKAFAVVFSYTGYKSQQKNFLLNE